MTTMSTFRPLPALTRDDLSYIRASFARLDEVSADPTQISRLIIDGRMPRPAYVLEDGVAMVGRDYLALLESAGSVDQLPALFAARYRAAAGEVGQDACDEAWQGYLTGEYAVCLRSVTPELIFLKDELVAILTAQLARPAPREAAWRRDLCERVTELDRITRLFAPCDRVRFGGPVSRDRLVDEPRRRYPAVFADALRSQRP